MLKIIQSNRFTKDLKLAFKRGYDLNELSRIIELLANKKALPFSCKDHALSGDYINFRECHIKPDWLLIYKIENDNLILIRLGSHSDLF